MLGSTSGPGRHTFNVVRRNLLTGSNPVPSTMKNKENYQQLKKLNCGIVIRWEYKIANEQGQARSVKPLLGGSKPPGGTIKLNGLRVC